MEAGLVNGAISFCLKDENKIKTFLIIIRKGIAGKRIILNKGGGGCRCCGHVFPTKGQYPSFVLLYFFQFFQRNHAEVIAICMRM
jgi:hypothetical protein